MKVNVLVFEFYSYKYLLVKHVIMCKLYLYHLCLAISSNAGPVERPGIAGIHVLDRIS